MPNSMTPAVTTDPLSVLGLDAAATSDEIRARYLELVKQFPPELDPDRFAEIREAYQLATDPVERWTRRLCVHIAGDVDPLLVSFRRRPPRMPTDALLKCGESVVTGTHKR